MRPRPLRRRAAGGRGGGAGGGGGARPPAAALQAALERLSAVIAKAGVRGAYILNVRPDVAPAVAQCMTDTEQSGVDSALASPYNVIPAMTCFASKTVTG